ncbi:RICIN domain-containing protein [Pontibacter sp. E15-1]|nr:RICIN domain-containing protein [Pontibacter sp. E15-1]
MVLDVNKACTGNSGNGNVVQRTAGITSQQQWQLSSTGDGYYRLTNTKCGLALGAKGEEVGSEESNVMIWDYTETARQQWNLIALENGSYNIVNRHSGLSLTVLGASVADGANVKQAAYTGGENQQFSLAVASGSMVTAVSEVHQVQQMSSAVVYPNPTASDFVIEAEGAFAYMIWDQIGRQVAQGSAYQSIKTGSDLKPGLYLIKVMSKGQVQQFKLIKSR